MQKVTFVFFNIDLTYFSAKSLSLPYLLIGLVLQDSLNLLSENPYTCEVEAKKNQIGIFFF